MCALYVWMCVVFRAAPTRRGAAGTAPSRVVSHQSKQLRASATRASVTRRLRARLILQEGDPAPLLRPPVAQRVLAVPLVLRPVLQAHPVHMLVDVALDARVQKGAIAAIAAAISARAAACC